MHSVREVEWQHKLAVYLPVSQSSDTGALKAHDYTGWFPRWSQPIRKDYAMATHTGVTTITTNAADVRQIMALATTEIAAIIKAARHVPCDFHLDSALCDCSLLVLNDCIAAIQLQIYIDTRIIREYRYLIVAGAVTPYGPDATQPPLGYCPPESRIRLIVASNPEMPWDYVQAWYRRLGWTDVEPFEYPANTQYTGYGNFVSGGLAFERQLRSDPQYDHAPQTSGRSANMQKRR